MRYVSTASAARKTESVAVRTIGDSSTPNSSTWVRPHQLAVSVAHVDSRRDGARTGGCDHRLGHDGGDARPEIRALAHGGLADEDAGDIGDRVARSGRQRSRHDAEIADTRGPLRHGATRWVVIVPPRQVVAARPPRDATSMTCTARTLPQPSEARRRAVPDRGFVAGRSWPVARFRPTARTVRSGLERP